MTNDFDAGARNEVSPSCGYEAYAGLGLTDIFSNTQSATFSSDAASLELIKLHNTTYTNRYTAVVNSGTVGFN